jgi:hypothetical protein
MGRCTCFAYTHGPDWEVQVQSIIGAKLLPCMDMQYACRAPSHTQDISVLVLLAVGAILIHSIR